MEHVLLSLVNSKTDDIHALSPHDRKSEVHLGWDVGHAIQV